jgi:hypothetical protein
MKGLLLGSGIEPLIDDFNVSLTQQTDQAIKDRFTDFTQDGICHNDAGVSLEFTLAPNSLDQTKIDMGFGNAYSSGERISISTNTIYNPNNPSTITDGEPTPISTGNIAIPLANYATGTRNFFWVQYLQAVDPTSFSVHPITGQVFFMKLLDGYIIVVNTTNDPAVLPLANSVFIGTVTAQGVGNPIPTPNIDYSSNRTYSLVRPFHNRLVVPKADRSDVTTVYTAQLDTTLDAHARAIGTGIVTPTNPHGLTLADLGVVSNLEPLNQLYQEETHDNKIRVADVDETNAGLYAQFIQVDPGNDFVQVYNLGPTESLYVNGIRKATADVMAGASPITISFANQVTNIYYCYLDNNGNVAITSDWTNTIFNNGYLQIFAAQWNPYDPSTGGDLFNPDTGLRGVKDIRTLIGENNTEVRFSQPLAAELFPGRRWLNISTGQFYGVKDDAGTIVILG